MFRVVECTDAENGDKIYIDEAHIKQRSKHGGQSKQSRVTKA